MKILIPALILGLTVNLSLPIVVRAQSTTTQECTTELAPGTVFPDSSGANVTTTCRSVRKKPAQTESSRDNQNKDRNNTRRSNTTAPNRQTRTPRQPRGTTITPRRGRR